MKRIPLRPWVLVVAGLVGCASVAWAQPRAGNKQTTAKKLAAPAPFCGIGVVFVANGSGGDPTLTDNLTEALRGARLPFAVDTTVWTVGRGAIADHNNVPRHLECAASMAAKVLAFRKAYPDRLVILIGHSSGTHVVLRAAEMLPENTVDRIILLAPSVACNFDLRQALKSSRGGIDAYWSPEDTVLEIAADYLGTADRQTHISAAGRVGFAVPARNCPDAALYDKLHQLRWDTGLQRYGHWGGHYGWVRTRSLRQLIVPTLMISDVPVEAAKK